MGKLTLSTLDREMSNTKGRVCGSKYFSAEEVSNVVQVVEKSKPAGRDQWDKLDVKLCTRRIQSWIEAKEWSDLSKSVRQDHPRAETTWFQRGS
jgi:hypothetical protein